jgi:PAS domain S-box-containing protein
MDPRSDKVKVLYVDDEEGNLMAFRASFRRDFDIHVAQSAKDALAWLEDHEVQVVISDQRMPGMNGADFLSIVRSRWPKAVRLLLTGFSDLQAVVDAINLGGIHAYITKPWDPTDLKLRIEQAHEIHVLREERERLFNQYRQVFDASGDPIMMVDSNSRILDANPAALQLMKMDKAALLATGLGHFIVDHPALARRMRARRDGNIYRNVDVTLRTLDGRTIDCLLTATMVGRTPEGSHLYQAMVKDISDRKQQEIYLEKLNSDLDKRVNVRTKQLMEALDDLGAFSYSVAHDLRSPLKNIKVMSDHLSSMASMRGDEDERDLSQRIHKGASRLINLVDNLLRFARTDSRKVESMEIDAAGVAMECIRELPVKADQTEFVVPKPGEAMIHADPTMLRVVLDNLIGNAVKFTKEKAKPRIEIGHTRNDGADILWVKDNGIGFESDKNEQVFGVFKRLHSAERFEGTGIGLALVDRIMKKHGGYCWAEGAPEEGATIYVRFPAKGADQELRRAG